LQELNRRKGIDRFNNSVLTLEGVKEIEKTCDFLLAKGTFISLRTRMDLMLSLNMLLRSEDRRNMEMPEVFIITAYNEGPGPEGHVPALCLRLLKGKVSPFFNMI